MTGFSDYYAQAALNNLVGKTAMPALPAHVYVALFTAVGTDAGTGFTEVSGGSYARAQTSAADWNAASGSGPSSISNANAVTFPKATASWGTVIAFGLYDAPTGGNLLDWDFLGNFSWKPFTCSAVGSGNGTVITLPGHGYANGDAVYATTEYGGTFPTFTQSNFTGQLAAANVTTDTFTVTNGGTAVWTSSTGSGEIRKEVGQSIPSGVTASFAGGAPGTLVLTSA